jgi:hypothetical protein
MKKPYLQALLLVPFVSAAFAEWVPFTVDKHVAVQLPSQPTEIDLAKLMPSAAMQHARLWALRAPEGVYMLMRLRTGSASISQRDTAGRRDYYAGVIQAVLQDEHGQPLTRSYFATPAGAGAEFQYKGRHQVTGKQVIKYIRTLVIDSVGYSLNFIPTDQQDSLGLAGNAQRRRFFNSLLVKP